jgi:hypothetical protein
MSELVSWEVMRLGDCMREGQEVRLLVPSLPHLLA